MIEDYTRIFTKNDLNIFRENSIFLENINKNTAYFNVDFHDYDGEEKLPDNFIELAYKLQKLGVFGELRKSNNYEDGFFAIEEYFSEKVELLYEILFDKSSNLSEISILNKLLSIVNKENHIDIQFIKLRLNLQSNIHYHFNDIEVLLHSLQINNPEKIDELIIELSNNIIQEDSKALLEQIKKEKGIERNTLRFDESTGNVFLGKDKLGIITPGNQEFFLFKFLFDRKGEFQTHSSIIKSIKREEKYEKTDSSYASDIKKRLAPEIKAKIQSKRGGYLIP